MKATLATLACLLTAGLLTAAASVDGNNTAVVIRKNVVESDNGYQFLCVPVNGLDITGGETGGVALNTMLPPETLEEGTMLTIGTTSYSVQSVAGVKTWVEGVAGTNVANVTLEGGTIFWLSTPTQTQTMSLNSLFSAGASDLQLLNASPSEPIVFCGQDRARTTISPVSGEATAMCNDSSESVALKDVMKDVIDSPKQGDQILTIKSGTSEYEIYRYLGGKWYGPGFNNDCSETTLIAPGEAFYYYTK